MLRCVHESEILTRIGVGFLKLEIDGNSLIPFVIVTLKLYGNLECVNNKSHCIFILYDRRIKLTFIEEIVAIILDITILVLIKK